MVARAATNMFVLVHTNGRDLLENDNLIGSGYKDSFGDIPTPYKLVLHRELSGPNSH